MSRRIKKFCQATILVLGLWIMGSCTFSVSAATNLLISGSGENGMEGWTDPDQATLRLDYLDKNGKVLASDQTKQRNPQWSKHTITLSVPSGTVKARIHLIAQRFLGQDNDAYFDDVSFYTIGNNINKVFITGEKSWK